MTLSPQERTSQELEAFYSKREHEKVRNRNVFNKPKHHPGKDISYQTYIQRRHIQFLLSLTVPISSVVYPDQTVIVLDQKDKDLLAYIERKQAAYAHRCENEDHTMDTQYVIVQEMLEEAKQCLTDPYIKLDESCIDQDAYAAEKSVSIAADETIIAHGNSTTEQLLVGASLR